jgi:hypothetical protein
LSPTISCLAEQKPCVGFIYLWYVHGQTICELEIRFLKLKRIFLEISRRDDFPTRFSLINLESDE